MRHRMIVLATTVALIGGAGTAGASYAAITSITEPNANGVITSCYNTTTGVVKMVNSGATCAAGSTKLTWASNRKPKVHVVGAAGEPPYLDLWKAYNGPPFGNASFYKDSAGIVHLTGLTCWKDNVDPSLCESGTFQFGETAELFTLPVGFRPANQVLFNVLGVGGGEYLHNRGDVTQAGLVEILAAPTNVGQDWVSLDGISFLAK
jgi:hypothetical protein